MVGWISIVLFVGFLVLLVKVLIDSVLDIGATLTTVSVIALILFGLGMVYLGSDTLLVLSLILFAGLFIKQRIL
mgnify:CR=1 FL=1